MCSLLVCLHSRHAFCPGAAKQPLLALTLSYVRRFHVH